MDSVRQAVVHLETEEFSMDVAEDKCPACPPTMKVLHFQFFNNSPVHEEFEAEGGNSARRYCEKGPPVWTAYHGHFAP